MRCRNRLNLFLLAGIAAAGPLAAADVAWPGFRGPNSDGAVPEARLFEGIAPSLSVAWNVELGSGYSALAVGDGRVAAMFEGNDGDYLAVFDVETGKESWRYRISDPHKGHDGSHDGPISTPVMALGRIYGLGGFGHLFAVDAATGVEIWRKHLVDDLGADQPHYGFSSSPLVVDGVLVITASQSAEDEEAPEDAKSETEKKPRKPMAVAGFEAASGKTLWIAGDDSIGYHSPIVTTLGGVRQVVASGRSHVYGLDPRTGAVLWSHDHGGDDHAMGGETIVPVPAGGDRIFLMNKLESSVMLEVERKSAKWEVKELWSSGTIARSYVVPAYRDGHLYGMNNRIFTCMSAATGELVWRSREPGDGFPIVVGDKLVVITKPGSLHVIDASPAGYHELARLDLFQEHSWSEVAYAGGHLFARSMARLARVDLAASEAPPTPGPSWLAETLLGRFLAELDRASDKSAAIDAFLAKHPSMPVVEDDGTAHFLYRAKAEDVGIVGDMIGFRREDPMIRVPGTDLFHYSTRLEPTAAVTYGFLPDYGTAVPDPLNPRKASGLFGDVSWFAMPGWDAPAYLDEAAASRQGQLVNFEWTSAVLEGQKRQARVYLPAGYEASDRRYPTIFVNFGKEAIEQGRMKNALDHLIGSRIVPLVAVFVLADEKDPNGDLRNDKYPEMIATELVPAIDANYRTITEARSRASIGFGRSASAAVVQGFRHPETFGRVAGQSALLDVESIPDLGTRGADVRPLVIYLDWGTYHMRSPHEAWSLTDSNRMVWKALREAGYRPAGGERPEGFGWPIWAGHTDELLAALFPLQR